MVFVHVTEKVGAELVGAELVSAELVGAEFSCLQPALMWVGSALKAFVEETRQLLFIFFF